MKTPDFAFPKTVEADSRKQLEKALREGKDIEALRAFMNLTIASQEISTESMPGLLKELDSISLSFKAPYNAIGYLLQAEIYQNIYRADQWNYDSRTVAAGMTEENPEFWDRDLFASKIDTLLLLALSERKAASAVPLDRIEELITVNNPIKSFTVYDFIVYKAIELSRSVEKQNVLPFFNDREKGIEPATLLDQLLELHSGPTPARITAIVEKADIMQRDAGAAYMWDQIQSFGIKPEAGELVIRFYDSFRSKLEDITSTEGIPDLPEFYKFVERLRSSAGSASLRDSLGAIMDNISVEKVYLQFPTLVQTNREFEVDANSSNIGEFYVLLLELKEAETNSYKISELGVKTRTVASEKVASAGEIPFSSESKLHFTVHRPGRYTLVASRTPDIRGLIHQNSTLFYPTVFVASDIDIINVGQMDHTLSDNKPGCFVVESAEGAPVGAASVRFEEQTTYWQQKNRRKKTVVTDKNGLAASPFPDAYAYAEFNGSEASGAANTYINHTPDSTQNIRVLTDRAVYRPGDIVRFFGIAFSAVKNVPSLDVESSFKIDLNNANDEVVDSLELKTDGSGRIYGEFTLPSDGLLGTWNLQAFREVFPGKWDSCNECTFEVAEYKTPSLLVTLEKSGASSDSIEFKGKASTYSGMPLGGSKVSYTVEYTAGWWWWPNQHESGSFSSSVTAGPDGEFVIKLPLANLDPKEYRGTFTIRASATGAAGETADSPGIPFWLSASYRLDTSIPDLVCFGEDSAEKQFKVAVLDMAGLPAVKTVEYKITATNDETIEEGEFQSPAFRLKSLPSGEYFLSFSIKGEESQPMRKKIVIYRLSDRKPPVDTALWVPVKEYSCPVGKDKISVDYGSSYPGQYILVFISDSKGNEEFFWVVSDGCNTKFDVDAPKPDERRFVNFIAFRDHEYHSSSVTLVPESQYEKLEIKTETFRKTLDPGHDEEWKFSLLYGGRPVEAFAYALLYDSAIDAIYPLHWNTNLFSPVYPTWLRLHGMDAALTGDRFSGPIPGLPYCRQMSINFQTFGYPLYTSRRGIRFYGSARRKNALYKGEAGDVEVMEEPCMSFMMADGFAADYVASNAITGSSEEAAEEEETRGVLTDDEADEEEKEFRPVEMPVAFFHPELTTDHEGNLAISFTVPNFNTTWNFLLGAYTPRLASASISLETVASKKVMVKMLPPRFLRTGDKATVTASVYNNSEERQKVSAEFEIFNPVSGDVLFSTVKDGLDIEPSGNMVVSVDIDCPFDINTLGLRVYARCRGASDGEQTVIPVLPSSQPVVESDPFYLAPGQEAFDMSIDKTCFEKDISAKVTFKYCDNPVWEVLTALPPITEADSESLTSQIAALYANCVGHGILEKNASLRKGLELILEGKAGDDMLTSHLEKDKELKTVTLNNTPWVNDARSETLRLSRLGTLLDRQDAERAINAAWNKIMGLRNPDGGWSWCQGMKSSQWMTEAFLINVGLLKAGGYLPEFSDAEEATTMAVGFIDGEYVKNYMDLKGDKSWFYISMLRYLYTRSFFPEAKATFSFANLKKEALDHIDRSWEQLSIFEKATATITLWREGYRMTAREILESLRQFASESPEKGAWFDNLDSGWRGAGKMLTTARVLMAYDEIQPSDSLIDKLRQWMVIQRQSQDWQEGLWSIDAIDALLNTGTEWTGEYASPEISVAGRKISASEAARLTGEVTADVNLSQADGDAVIEIRRHSPGPAWGGVISQFIAPMDEVRPDSIADLSIRKEFWKIVEDEDGVKAVGADQLEIGDKVRVTMIVDCGRDMDFVVLTDQRPACLEPSDQLSGYTARDGLWCYSETRNSATNLFFDFLPRGRHIISYECRVMEKGEFASGVAILQCLYSPLLTAHSGGMVLTVGLQSLQR